MVRMRFLVGRLRALISLRASAVIAVLSINVFATVAIADVIVLDVQGTTKWSRGQVVTDGTVIHLPNGVTMKLIKPNDDVFLLRGPFNGPVSSATADDGFLYPLVKKFLDAMKLVVRAETEPRAGDPDVVDLTTSGAKCVSRGLPLVFWKRKHEKAERAIIMNGETSQEMRWGVNETIAPWPKELTQTARREYVVNFVRTGEARSFSLHFKPVGIAAPKAVVAWMLSEGCFDQAAILLGRLPADLESAGSAPKQ